MSIENSIYDPQLEDQTIETISKWDDLDINPDLLQLKLSEKGLEKIKVLLKVS